jgi:hypothetical protein
MRKKISFVILTNSGSPAKQFRTSRSTLIWIVGIVLIAFGFSGYVGYDYYRLRNSSFLLQLRDEELSSVISSQRDEIQLQRKQISEFASDINKLKDQLLTLGQFEKKIRIMADIDKRPDVGNPFGMGGPTPRNMDPKMALGADSNSLMREMHTQVDQINLAAVNQENGFKELVVHLERQQSLLASTPTIRPIDPDVDSWASSKFEWRVSPFTNQREFHKAFDIAAREGTPIYATASGVVTFAGNKGLLGKTLIIDHGHGLTTLYGHCSKILKQPGERVGRWDTVALVGNTGSSTGPHVHYEVLIHGVQVNPEKYFLN